MQGLPDSMKERQKLSHVNLKNNDLEIVPSCMFCCSQLRYVNFNCNKISSIPYKTGVLQSLTELHFHNKPFKDSDHVIALKKVKISFGHIDKSSVNLRRDLRLR